jgi:hypothetical protein
VSDSFNLFGEINAEFRVDLCRGLAIDALLASTWLLLLFTLLSLLFVTMLLFDLLRFPFDEDDLLRFSLPGASFANTGGGTSFTISIDNLNFSKSIILQLV